MREDDLAPGEVRISPIAIAGHQRYVMRKQDGMVERGSVVSEDHPCAVHADGILDASEAVRPGVRKVTRNIDYNAPGSTRSRPSTDAYRSGWDAVFGLRSGSGSCGPSQAN